jgi:site-specific DNA-methyltransferase (adenine-specific)
MPKASRPRDGWPSWWTTDDWATPPEFIATLEAEFGTFDLDPCATDETAKARNYFTREEDGLQQDWSGLVFVNPPYSNVVPWVEKAIAECRAERACSLLLLPNNTDTAWFHDLVLRWCSVRFLRGRIAFLGYDGQPVSGNRGGNILVAATYREDHRRLGFHL